MECHCWNQDKRLTCKQINSVRTYESSTYRHRLSCRTYRCPKLRICHMTCRSLKPSTVKNMIDLRNHINHKDTNNWKIRDCIHAASRRARRLITVCDDLDLNHKLYLSKRQSETNIVQSKNAITVHIWHAYACETSKWALMYKPLRENAI